MQKFTYSMMGEIHASLMFLCDRCLTHQHITDEEEIKDVFDFAYEHGGVELCKDCRSWVETNLTQNMKDHVP